MGITIIWFKKIPEEILQEIDTRSGVLVSSFFAPPRTLYINELLKSHTRRLKYDLAVHIAHNVLHNKDIFKSVTVAPIAESEQIRKEFQSSTVNSRDILYAWRDFECSFFAGALLCPKVPFRQLLDQQGYSVSAHKLADVSASVAMRRMTAVSPYTHWHYFDAYSPGKLKAVYRGNGIPLPWGNMRKVEDPCQHWAVFRMINAEVNKPSAQISILNVKSQPRIYCCDSVNVNDLAGNKHVICAGIDLNPAIEAQGHDAVSLAQELKEACIANGGSAGIPKDIKADLMSVARILNISWVGSGIESDARLICSRGSACPRDPGCYSNK